jgi:putative FmdB family regulatory protein
MPLYDVKCTNCDLKEEVMIPLKDLDTFVEPCPDCGGHRERLFPIGTAVQVWGERVFENIDVHPVTTTSLKQLKEECRKRNVIVPAYM